jgi:hypothetical protein
MARTDGIMALNIKIDGKTHDVDIDGETALLWVSRYVLGMTGMKFGCGVGSASPQHAHRYRGAQTTGLTRGEMP